MRIGPGRAEGRFFFPILQDSIHSFLELSSLSMAAECTMDT